MADYAGGCHCGNISVTFSSGMDPRDIVPRACQCSFCRKHSTRALSDPRGRIHLHVSDGAALGRYRFAQEIGDYLFCTRCGVYVSAYMEDGGAAYANVMASVMEAHEAFAPAEPVDYAGEDEAGKRARRRRGWTPASIRIENRPG